MNRALAVPLLALVLSLWSAAAVEGRQPEASGKRPMTVEDLWKLKRVGAPSVSPDGKWCVVEVTSWDLAKDESSSDLWLLSTDGKTQRQLTTHPGKSSGPKWSPDGEQIAFVAKRGNDQGPQVYVIHPAGGEARRVTNMPMAPGHLKWGADGKTIYAIAWTWLDTPCDATHQRREQDLKDSKVKALVIDDAAYRYWDRWIADGKRPMVFAIDVATGKHRNLMMESQTFLPPYEPSDKDYDVSPDGQELAFVADSIKDIGTDQNLDVYVLALNENSPPKNLTRDNPANDASPVYSPDGGAIAFVRQTIKFFYADRGRLMVYQRASGKLEALTESFDRTVANPRWVSERAEPGRPQAGTLLVEVEDSGYVSFRKLTWYGGGGQVSPPLTQGYSDRALDLAFPGGNEVLAVFLRSSFDLPGTVFAMSLQGGNPSPPRAISHFNDELVSSWDLGKVESVVFKGADDRDVQMWIVYPPGFDAKKRWPLIQMVHGGPHNAFTTEFSFRWNPQLWAAQGWVIGIVNFHGSSGFGQEFADSITGDMGTKPTTDVMKATDWFERQPWIDKDRIATAGASYGGYLMAWLNGHTDRFKAMVCHAGVFSYHGQIASDLVRGRERALGAAPWGGDLAKIDAQSAERFAANFKTPTLVIHGEKDYRVPVTQGLAYYNTLRMKGVPTRLVYFPDENHWILKAQNSILWHREVFGWLKKYVGSGPSREEGAAP